MQRIRPVRYLCGTQPILSMAALDCGLDTVLAAEPLGGMTALRTKSLALTDLFLALVAQRCAGLGLGVAPCPAGDASTGPGQAGNQDILRFGFTPLYVGYVDVWNAVEQLKQVLETEEWQRPEFNLKHAVM